MLVDMTINILHKPISSGTGPTKVHTEVPSEVLVESKGCMGSLTKDMAYLHRHPMINSTQHLQRMLVPLASNILGLVGIVPLLED